MTKTFEIRRNGAEWALDDGVTIVAMREPTREILERAVVSWQVAEENQMRIATTQAYEEAAARIQRLADAKEGTPEARELADLVAAVQDWEARKSPLGEGDASAPGYFRTARHLGQPGDETELRAGPNPRSPHSTGPHPPFETQDPEGMAAEKHRPKAADASSKGEPAERPSGTIRSVDLKRTVT